MFFCLIHGDICMAIQAWCICAMLRVYGNPNAGTNLYVMMINDHILTQLGDDFFGD